MIRRIGDLNQHDRCRSTDHKVPANIVLPPGIYEHVCSGCGRRVVFRITGIENKSIVWARSGVTREPAPQTPLSADYSHVPTLDWGSASQASVSDPLSSPSEICTPDSSSSDYCGGGGDFGGGGASGDW